MKIKPLYIYGPLVIILLIFLFVYTNNTNTAKVSNEPSGDINGKTMPNDSVHRNLQNPLSESPSGNNATDNAKHEVEMLKKEIEKHPNDTLKIRQYADYLASHQPEESIKYYEKILKVNPRRIDILFSLSFIYYNQGNLNQTEKLTSKILSYDKDNLKALYNLGAISARKGDREKARALWNRIIVEHPDDETAQLARASLQKL